MNGDQQQPYEPPVVPPVSTLPLPGPASDGYPDLDELRAAFGCLRADDDGSNFRGWAQ
jgi:hypothetical protein